MSLRQIDQIASRRRFLQFLAASPLLADVGAPAFAQNMSAPSRLPDPMTWAPRDLDNLISDPKEALDVFDFEPVAKKNLAPAHFGYMVAGIDDEVTLRANREGFLRFQLRPRRLLDVGTIDMTTEILGATYDSPIVIAPPAATGPFTRTEKWRLRRPQDRQSPANSLLRGDDIDRGVDRSTRRACMVPVVRAGLVDHRSPAQTGGTKGGAHRPVPGL